jgi:small-conductance mechanosensitive channel
LALLITTLREPIAVTLKGAMHEALLQELPKYETVVAANARLEKHSESENEILRRLEQNLAAIRDKATISESDHQLLVEVSHCLTSMETKLDLLIKEFQRDRKPPDVKNGS